MLELIGQGGIASENGDYQSLYASQAFPLIKHRTAVEVFEELKKGVWVIIPEGEIFRGTIRRSEKTLWIFARCQESLGVSCGVRGGEP